MRSDGDTFSKESGHLFEIFQKAHSFQGTLQVFDELCQHLGLQMKGNGDPRVFYSHLKESLDHWKARALWNQLDKRAVHEEYHGGQACSGTKCLVIGAGPCGLRMAIEMALLGATTVVVEKREDFLRNNVLHLWPFNIHDLRELGAKTFYGKFCAGSIDHISIRQLQLILLKVCLILGVKVHSNTAFVNLLEPSEGVGWRAKINPDNHSLSSFEFDVIIGADGANSTLKGFKSREFRGKLAIGITANFVNNHTPAELQVEEISGVAYIFNQQFFHRLREATGIDLENIVYYNDETHYFVMTAKKQSLINKGVLLQDLNDAAALLAKENVNRDALQGYAHEAADFSTGYQLPHLDFAFRKQGEMDVAVFDFTCMHAGEHSSLVRHMAGYPLLACLVGDGLMEPFWPMGTGCARGFLAVFDSAWMVRGWSQGVQPLTLLAERESLFKLLPQTTSTNISSVFSRFTIDPATRYPNLTMHFKPAQVQHLFMTDDSAPVLPNNKSSSVCQDPNIGTMSKELLAWCQQCTGGHNDVHIIDLGASWQNGLGLCALLHHFRPDLIDFVYLHDICAASKWQFAMDLVERELNVPPVATGEEMAASGAPNQLYLSYYLSQLRELLPHWTASRETADAVAKPGGRAQYIMNQWKRKITKNLLQKERESNKRRKSKSDEQGNVEDKRSKLLLSTRVDPENDQHLASNSSSPAINRQVKHQKRKTAGGSDVCCFCAKPLYVFERLSAEGRFFHRECLRCHHCQANLHVGNSAFDPNEGNFYCKPHFAFRKTIRKAVRMHISQDRRNPFDKTRLYDSDSSTQQSKEDLSTATDPTAGAVEEQHARPEKQTVNRSPETNTERQPILRQFWNWITRFTSGGQERKRCASLSHVDRLEKKQHDGDKYTASNQKTHRLSLRLPRRGSKHRSSLPDRFGASSPESVTSSSDASQIQAEVQHNQASDLAGKFQKSNDNRRAEMDSEAGSISSSLAKVKRRWKNTHPQRTDRNELGRDKDAPDGRRTVSDDEQRETREELPPRVSPKEERKFEQTSESKSHRKQILINRLFPKTTDVTDGVSHAAAASVCHVEGDAVAEECRKLKQFEQQQLNNAQMIQRQLQEIEEKQRGLEHDGTNLEKQIREIVVVPLGSPPVGEDVACDGHLMDEWFKLVQERNGLIRFESELVILMHELELTDRQNRLKQQLQKLLTIDDKDKSEEQCREEEERLQELLEVVDQRDMLVNLLDNQRLLEKQEDQDLESALATKRYALLG
uniref:F-actin-monooxygenase mical1-like isoform X2 n=1 Tax=Myxine glutinosa TaxID=7769 RepID=UPI00358FD04D